VFYLIITQIIIILLLITNREFNMRLEFELKFHLSVKSLETGKYVRDNLTVVKTYPKSSVVPSRLKLNEPYKYRWTNGSTVSVVVRSVTAEQASISRAKSNGLCGYNYLVRKLELTGDLDNLDIW